MPYPPPTFRRAEVDTAGRVLAEALHARDLLSEHGYRRFLEDIERRHEGREPKDPDLLRVAEPDFEYNTGKPEQPKLF